MDQNEDIAGLCAFLRQSRYQVVQPYTKAGWGPAWTFVGNDLHAAERAGWMMKRMGAEKMRHASRARLRTKDGRVLDAVIVTEFPGPIQKVLDIQTVQVIPVARLLPDESLRALGDAAGL